MFLCKCSKCVEQADDASVTSVESMDDYSEDENLDEEEGACVEVKTIP